MGATPPAGTGWADEAAAEAAPTLEQKEMAAEAATEAGGPATPDATSAVALGPGAAEASTAEAAEEEEMPPASSPPVEEAAGEAAEACCKGTRPKDAARGGGQAEAVARVPRFVTKTEPFVPRTFGKNMSPFV